MYQRENRLHSGQMMPDFTLTTSEGEPIRISDFRNRYNLVLIFTGDTSTEPLQDFLEDLSDRKSDIQALDARAFVIVPGDEARAARFQSRMGLNLTVLADPDGSVYHRVLGIDRNVLANLQVYVIDRFGEIYSSFETGDHESLPTADEVLSWLDFIEIQCPE